MRQLPISELLPGMILAKDVYTDDDKLIIPANFRLFDRSITRLEYYSIPAVYIQGLEDEISPPTPVVEQSYSTRIKQSPEYQKFSTEFQKDVDHFKSILNDVVEKNAPLAIDILLQETLSLLDNTRGGIHVFDMLHNLRHFDDLTYTHGLNVSLICNVLATWLNFSPEDVELATQCGLLHDIGKLKIPEEIIKKPARLTDAEYEIIKKHPVEGYHILKKCQVNPHIINSALMHHERCDGGGYPLGLTAGRIDKFAKLVSIADVYDAMTSARIYRGPLCPFKVIEIFEHEGLQKYDTRYIMTFLENIVNTYISQKVRLSDNRIGTIILSNPRTLSRPLVKCDDTYVDLSKEPSSLTIEEIL